MKYRLHAAALLFACTAANAQVATDGSVGQRLTLAGPNYQITPGLGTFLNGNLFHSFGTFNIAPGATATFLGQPGLVNIIGRITDPHASLIQGTVRSAFPGASLYLINPNGIVFGPGAFVDVNGSFYATSATYLRFSDGTRFDSRIGPPVTLSYASPNGFGFDAGYIAPLIVQGATLRAAEGATVGLVGGGILIGDNSATSRVQALGGHAILVAVASPGVVEYDASGIRLAGFTALADVVLHHGADVTVNEGTRRAGSGTVFVRGNQVAIDQATIEARTAFANGGGIDIGAAADVTISGASNVVAVTTGAGNAGSIRLAGRNVTVSQGALVDTSCDPGCTSGNGGLLQVVATDTFYIDGTTQSTAPTFVVSNSFGSGRTGEIDVTAGTLVMDGAAALQGIGIKGGDATSIHLRTGNIVLRNGAQVDASSRGTGHGGQVVVDNSGVIHIEGTRADPTQNGLILPSGIFSNTEGTGNAGSIVVSTRNLEVLAGGEISSAARRGSTGAGGNVTVNATDTIRVAGTDSTGKASGIVTNTFASGDAGEINLSAKTIVVADKGEIQSQSEGAGRAGRIRIAAQDLTLLGQGQVSSDARAQGNAGAVELEIAGTLSITGGNSGIFAKTYGPAQGGSISIDAGKVVLDSQGGIFATTDGSGSAGSIALHAHDSIAMSGQSRIASETTSSGAAGNLNLNVDGRIDMAGGSQISTSTGVGGGDAGTVTLSAGTGIAMSDGARITSESHSSGRAGNLAVSSNGAVEMAGAGTRISTSASNAGDAGTVTLFARDAIGLSNGAIIASESSGAGLAGNLDVQTGGRLDLSSGARITTSAAFSDGGNIHIQAGTQAFLQDASIATAVGTGQGNGGNIVLDIPSFIMRGSTVSANAFGGNGGNIHLSTDRLFKSAESTITASSQLGLQGTITFDSPAIDPSGSLLAPVPMFLDAGAVLAGRCGPRFAGRASSLLIAPRAPETGYPGELRALLGRSGTGPSTSCVAEPQAF